MTSSIVSAVLLMVALIVLSVLLLLGRMLFRKDTGNDYNLLTHFPHELIHIKGRKTNIVVWSIFIALLMISSGFMLDFGQSFNSILLFSGSFIALCFFFLVGIAAPTYYKTHLASYIISTILSAIVSAIYLLYFSSKTDFYLGNQLALRIVFSVIFSLIFVFFIIMAFNPALRNWWRLKTEISEEGVITNTRPKIFVLAFSEWLCLFGFILMQICAIVFNLVIGI